jgi:hypothetical protein
MTAGTRLDFLPPFLDLSIAVHDVARLSAIAVTVMNSIIRDVPASLKPAGLTVDGSHVVVLTEEEYRSVHFITEHIRGIAQTAAMSLEAVESLIAEHRLCA